MARIYVVYGLMVCGLLMYANNKGLSWISALSSGRWSPASAPHGMYHK